jgi:DNA-binding transcriptional MerR regulator
VTDTSQKPYRSISDVSESLGVKAHVLRYWETQFPMLRPRKGRSGARMYRPKDLELLEEIRRLLYERGFTIAGARRKLLAERHPAEETGEIEGAPPPRAAGPLLREIRRELKALRALLAAPPEPRRRGR